jgi:hypothetical protein
LNREESEQAPKRVVEVQIWVQPFTSVVDAVPLVDNEILLLTIVEMFQVVGVASVELAREEGGMQDREQEHEEEDDHL